MPRQYGDYINPEYMFMGTTQLAENMPRRTVTTDLTAALVTQVMTSVAMPLQIGDVVTNISFRSAGTGAGTPTNYWFALYSTAATPALIAQTADQTSTAWGTNTTMTLALTTPYQVNIPGIYYAAIMVKATTVPTLAGATLFHLQFSTGLLTGNKILAQNSGSALTATAPATIASPTSQTPLPYCAIS